MGSIFRNEDEHIIQWVFLWAPLHNKCSERAKCPSLSWSFDSNIILSKSFFVMAQLLQPFMGSVLIWMHYLLRLTYVGVLQLIIDFQNSVSKPF